MAAFIAMALFLSLTSPLISASNGDNGEQTQITEAETSQTCSDPDNYLVCQIDEMKRKVARSELLLEMTALELNAKSNYIENCEKKIEEMSHNIHQLESVLSDLKVSSLKSLSNDEQKINALEEEVRDLEVGVKKNDRELHLLKVRTNDVANWVQLLASQVETMSKVVPELWFHVQKLEQAREVIERRTAELRMHIRNHRCSFFKFINKLSGNQHLKIVSAYTSEALNQLRRSISTLKKYHYQLQGFVKEELERNEFTSVLADQEFIFFVASALMVFPPMLALIWLLSAYRTGDTEIKARPIKKRKKLLKEKTVLA